MTIFVLGIVVGAGVASESDDGMDAVIGSDGSNEDIPVIVRFKDSVRAKDYRSTNSLQAKQNLMPALRARNESSIREVLPMLDRHGVKKYESLWIINGISMKASPELIQELKGMPVVEEVKADRVLRLPEDEVSPTGDLGAWNLDALGLENIWGKGIKGEGVVVAIMDSGVDEKHADLRGRWRGGDNSWYDPNGEHPTPYDKTGHGTQVAGLIVGGTATGKPIGVAPKAQWVGIKIYNDANEAAESVIHLGFQWALDPDGDEQTDDAPQIVNCSWGYESRVNECYGEFQTDIEILKTSGITVPCSSGNGGPNPSTSVSPANYPDTFAVGSTKSATEVSDFSGRGPSPCSGALYPDVVAPGQLVVTSDLTFGGIFTKAKRTVSGTSYAVSHVSGAMALLLSAYPETTVEALESVLREGANDLSPAGHDNVNGYGFVNIESSLNLLENMNKRKYAYWLIK